MFKCTSCKNGKVKTHSMIGGTRFSIECSVKNGMHIRWGSDTSTCKYYNEKELCPVCHGKGATTDHHDPCSECGGSGYYE